MSHPFAQVEVGSLFIDTGLVRPASTSKRLTHEAREGRNGGE